MHMMILNNFTQLYIINSIKKFNYINGLQLGLNPLSRYKK